MPMSNQEKGKRCEEFFEPILRELCPLPLEHLHEGADRKCGETWIEIKSCHSSLTKKQRQTKKAVEKSGGKYLILRCPCQITK